MAFYQLLICHGILITDSVKILIHMLREMMLISCSLSWKIVLKSYQAYMHMEVLKACNGPIQNSLLHVVHIFWKFYPCWLWKLHVQTLKVT